jgi:TetR/AcrR family transcriptional regulator
LQTTNKHLPANERREVTIEAVIALAGLQNPSEITTYAIAKHMNLSQGALFRHFATKEAIWQAVMEWVSDNLLAQIDGIVGMTEDPVAALQAMFLNHVEFAVTHPGVPRILFGELQKADATPAKQVAQIMLKRYSEKIGACLENGKALGTIAPEIDSKAATTLFIGTIQGLIMQSLLSGDIEQIRTNAPGVFAIYLRGLRGVQ